MASCRAFFFLPLFLRAVLGSRVSGFRGVGFKGVKLRGLGSLLPD